MLLLKHLKKSVHEATGSKRYLTSFYTCVTELVVVVFEATISSFKMVGNCCVVL